MNNTADPNLPWREWEEVMPEQGDEDERRCWVCGAEMIDRHCKIICPQCGFMRDCSDP